MPDITGPHGCTQEICCLRRASDAGNESKRKRFFVSWTMRVSRRYLAGADVCEYKLQADYKLIRGKNCSAQISNLFGIADNMDMLIVRIERGSAFIAD